MRRTFLWGIILVGTSGAFAGPKKIDYVSVLPSAAPIVSPLSENIFKLKLNIAKNIHIQANPTSAPNLIATTLMLETLPGVTWGVPVYPLGKPYRLQGASTDISTYDGKIEIGIPFTVTGNKKPLRLLANGKVRYQACNDKTCFFPVTLPISFTIQVK